MSRLAFTRRNLLTTASGLAVGLPWLEAFAPKAWAQTGPKRLVVFVHGQGTVLSRWKPAQVGTTFTLPQMLAALEPHKAKLNVWSNISNKVRNVMKSNGHNAAGRSLLSAHVFSNPDNEGSASAGPSIDQVVGTRIQNGTPLKTLNLYVGGGVGEYQMQFSGPGVAVGGISDPKVAFSRVSPYLMPGSTPKPVVTTLDRLRANRTPVLDAAKANVRSLSGTVGKEDKQRLDAHLARVEEMEKTLKPASGGTGPSAGCQKLELGLPASGYSPYTGSQENLGSRAQIHNAVMALSCGVTNVVFIQYTNYHGPTFDWLGVGLSGNWHDRVHAQGGNNLEGMSKAFAWYGQEFAYLVGKLDSINEGAGTMLDNTLCLWLSEFGDGGAHNTNDLPVVLAGNAGGKLPTGRHLTFPGRTHNDLFTTVLNLFGGTDTQFGYGGSEFNKGPLPVG